MIDTNGTHFTAVRVRSHHMRMSLQVPVTIDCRSTPTPTTSFTRQISGLMDGDHHPPPADANAHHVWTGGKRLPSISATKRPPASLDGVLDPAHGSESVEMALQHSGATIVADDNTDNQYNNDMKVENADGECDASQQRPSIGTKRPPATSYDSYSHGLPNTAFNYTMLEGRTMSPLAFQSTELAHRQYYAYGSSSAMDSATLTAHPATSGKRLPRSCDHAAGNNQAIDSYSHGYVTVPGGAMPASMLVETADLNDQDQDVRHDRTQPRRTTRPRHPAMKKAEQESSMATLQARLEMFNKAAAEKAAEQAIVANSIPGPVTYHPLMPDGTYTLQQPPLSPVSTHRSLLTSSCDQSCILVASKKRKQPISPSQTDRAPEKHRERPSSKKQENQKPKNKKVSKGPVAKAARNKLNQISADAKGIMDGLNEFGAPFEKILNDIATHSEQILVRPGNADDEVRELHALTKAWKSSNRGHLTQMTTFFERFGVVAMGAVDVPAGRLDIIRDTETLAGEGLESTDNLDIIRDTETLAGEVLESTDNLDIVRNTEMLAVEGLVSVEEVLSNPNVAFIVEE